MLDRKGAFGGPPEDRSRSGEAERAALPNELEWGHRSAVLSGTPRRTKCENKPSLSGHTQAKRRLLTLWSVGM